MIRTNAASLGFHGGLGLEITLDKRVSLNVVGRGRYAKISHFDGTDTTMHYGFRDGGVYKEYITTTKKGILFYFEKDNYPRMAVYEVKPTNYESVREASFDFSGFTLQAGLKIRF
jgi:hypothetical protein